MKRLFAFFPLVILLLGCGKGGTGLLPEELDGFQAVGSARHFVGEKLFDYMDGGAELFLEYGFVQLWVREYRGGKGAISVEVYEMKDPPAAFGIWTAEGKGKRVPVGQGGRWGGGLLSFWKGKHYVRLLSEGEREEGLLPLGEAIAERISEEGELPHILTGGELPQALIEGGDYLFFRGPIALNNFVFISHRDPLKLAAGAEGIAFRWPSGGKVVVVSYPDPSVLADVFRSLPSSGTFKKVTRQKKGVLFGRSRRGLAMARFKGKSLFLALDFPSEDELLRFMRDFLP